METISYKTLSVSKEAAANAKRWYVVDAEDEVLGRLAAKVAFVLRGKHKPEYTPHIDCGDNVVIINAAKVKLTGAKPEQKYYLRHSGFPGGQTATPIRTVLAKYPERVVEHAVKGMLPKNRLGRKLYRNLYVYAGNEHKQEAQKPEMLDLNTIK